MKRKLLLICFLLFVLSEGFSTVVFPHERLNVSAAGFLPSALGELRERGVFVVFDTEGRPVGFIENGTFWTSIRYGNLTVLPFSNNSDYVVGSFSLWEAVREMGKLRFEEGVRIDEELLKEEDYLRYVYYSQRYGSLESYLKDYFGIDTGKEAADFLSRLRIEEAADLESVFEALERGEVGYTQYLEILDALERITGSKLLDHLDKETKRALERYLKEIEREVAKRALREILDSIGKEELNLLRKILRHLDYRTLYEIARDYVREAARTGELDRIMENLRRIQDPAKEAMKEAALQGLKALSRVNVLEYLPKSLSYYLLIIAFVLLVVVLRGVVS